MRVPPRWETYELGLWSGEFEGVGMTEKRLEKRLERRVETPYEDENKVMFKSVARDSRLN